MFPPSVFISSLFESLGTHLTTLNTEVFPRQTSLVFKASKGIASSQFRIDQYMIFIDFATKLVVH